MRSEELSKLFDQAAAIFPRAPNQEVEGEVRELLRAAVDDCTMDAAEFALKRLSSADPVVRAAGCYLAGYACEVCDVARDKVATSLVALLNAESDPAVLWPLAQALGSTRTIMAIEPLTRLAGHDDSIVRLCVAMSLPWTLFEHADPLGIRALVWLTADPDADVRNWATFGLGERLEVDGPDIRAALVARLDDEHPEAREEGMIGLARRRDRRALPVVERYLEDGHASRLAFESAAYLADSSLTLALSRYSEEESGHALDECDPLRRRDRDRVFAELLVIVQHGLDASKTGLAASMARERFGFETWLTVNVAGEPRWSVQAALEAGGGDPVTAAKRVVGQVVKLIAQGES